MGAIAARYMKDGMLVPDEVVSSIVVDAIKVSEPTHGPLGVMSNAWYRS